MTQQKWEPGTVAMVDWEGESVVRILSKYGHTYGSDRSAWWGPEGYLRCEVEAIKGIRPLLVLDPDDPDQMRDLERRLSAADWSASDFTTNRVDAISVTVRAMLPKPTPVKPAEPTGLGAVVEDADGKWVRLDNSRLPWREWTSGPFRDWADFSAAVKVLSEGVTP